MSSLFETFNAANNEGKRIQLAPYNFVFAVSHDNFQPSDVTEAGVQKLSEEHTMLKGVAQLLLQRTLFNNEPCEDASNVVSIDHCERLRTTLGSTNIDMANTAYRDLLKEVAADITAFEGTLHPDPKIHNAMLVDYLINQKMTYKKDTNTFGRDDVWADPTITAATMQGDCEDYALLKLKVLMDLKIISPGEGYVGFIENKENEGTQY